MRGLSGHGHEHVHISHGREPQSDTSLSKSGTSTSPQINYPTVPPVTSGDSSMMQIFILSFSFSTAAEMCGTLQSWNSPCSQWEGVRIKGLENDTLVEFWRRSGLIAKPDATTGTRSHLGAALGHISAWRSIDAQQPSGPTLIFPEGDILRADRASEVRDVLINASVPGFDVLFLSTLTKLQPCSKDPTLPAHVLRLQPYNNLTQLSENTKATRLGAYAVSTRGATALLQLLKASPPDLATIPLETWILHKINDPSSSVHVLAWDNASDIIEARPGHVKSGLGDLVRVRPDTPALPSKFSRWTAWLTG